MSKDPTPLMQQYLKIKERYPEEILFFQVGDFYELFFEDAKVASSILAITLTKRGMHKGEYIPLCGVPVHMIEHYYPKLIKYGHTVVICNQKTEAQVGKIVERGVSEIITPSTIFVDTISENIYSLFIVVSEDTLTTFLFEFGKQEIIYKFYKNDFSGLLLLKSMVEKYQPKEIITYSHMVSYVYELLPGKASVKGFLKEEIDQKKINSFLKNYDLQEFFYTLASLFLSYINHYFENLLKKNMFLLREDTSEKNLFLDQATIKYLECVQNISTGTKENTLYELLDKTKTKMGSRLLKLWILNPLIDKDEIEKRHFFISFFLENKSIYKKIKEFLSLFGDTERLFCRLRLSKFRLKDFFSLYNFAKTYKEFISYFKDNYDILSPVITFFIDEKIIDTIINTVNTDASLKIGDQVLFLNPGVDGVLQSKFSMIENNDNLLDQFCQEEKKRSGIDDIVIKKTPLYSYVIELSKAKERKVSIPEYYVRVQTLTQRERYTCPGLQELSCQLISSQDDYFKLESDLKDGFITKLFEQISSFLSFSSLLARLDVYCSFVSCISLYQWEKPLLDSKSNVLDIRGARHPIASIKVANFIKNSLCLSAEKKNHIITGPNMGGKSTYMRQNALIILLSHIGSYIPAERGSVIPICDNILTRVGASDDIHSGKSTFFLELEEIKNIVSLATKNSFVIIDEIGRGTSTYDGISLAASILRYLIENNNPYLLCSTHFHEISDLLEGTSIFWYHMDFSIIENKIIFLYSLKEGKAEGSMGINLASDIGLPNEIIDKAKQYFLKMKNKQIKDISFRKNQPLVFVKSASEKYLDTIFSKKTPDDISRNEALYIIEKLYKSYSL